MDLSHLLKFCFYWLATISRTGNVPTGFDGDVLDALAGETFLVKTWADNRQFKSITVSKGNAIRLNVILVKSNLIISKDKYGVILLQTNNATRETSLILENCSKEDEGIYNVDEIVADTSPNASEREAGKWNFKLNVIEPSEVKKFNVGGIFKMEIRKSSILRNLYYYDQIVVANLLLCDVAIHSHLHGRLRCRIDSNRHVIIIQNVTQRDIGLYTIDNTSNGSNKGSTRYYLNVTDQATNAFIGENVTIDWFYSQQAINRTLRIIHSNNGIMMNLLPNNDAQIVPAFQTRLLYSGDVSRGYMSVTLLNVGKSDSGVYKIETLHVSTVFGYKHLIVQGVPPTANEVTELTPTLTKDSSSTREPSLVPSAEILDTEEYTTSPSLTVRLTSPANHSITSSLLDHVIYVVIGAMGLIIMMIGCLIWIQRSNRYSLKAVQQLILATSSSTLNSAPSAIRKQLPTTIVDEEGLCRLIRSTPVGNAQSVLKYRSNPDNSPSCVTQSTFAMSVPIVEDDIPGLTCKNIMASKESNKISIQTLPHARDNDMDGLLEDCPTVCILGSTASNAAVDLSQPDQVPYYPYAKVKKGQRSTFTNNNQFAFSSVPDGEFSDGYKMINFTLGNEPRNTFQNLEIVSESTIPVNVSLQDKDNTRNNYVRDSKNDDGYETCGNIKRMSCMEHVKVSEDEGAMTGKDQEPKNCMIPHCAMHSNYADIDI